jgi:hypothetical protein
MSFFKDRYAIRNYGNQSRRYQEVLLPCKDISSGEPTLHNWKFKWIVSSENPTECILSQGVNPPQGVSIPFPLVYSWPPSDIDTINVIKVLLGHETASPGAVVALRALRALLGIGDLSFYDRNRVTSWIEERCDVSFVGFEIATRTLDALFPKVQSIVLI